MQFRRTFLAVTFLTAIVVCVCPHSASAQIDDPTQVKGLSPYWWPAVSRWAHIVLPVAEERNLDPDLVASVIWKESMGQAWERGPVGAVGLMGVMPFEWRPSADELQNPWTNVAWGARALAHTIQDGEGDLYYSLAAYNGGWEQIHLRVTRNYAADVLNHYARAVAARYGLSSDGKWIAIFAVKGNSLSPRTITVVGPHRSLARYTERPWIQANLPSAPVDVPPHAIAITFVDARGVQNQVGVWLASEDGTSYTEISLAETLFPPVSVEEAREQQLPIPSATPTSVLAQDEHLTQVPSPTDTPMPASVAASPPGTPTPSSLSDSFAAVVSPLPTPTSISTATLSCERGALQINAWDIGKRLSPEGGWMATIFVGAHGGNCMYTYAWNGEVKGGPTPYPITFDVYQVDRFAPIMGTASVTSISQTIKVDLFIKAP